VNVHELHALRGDELRPLMAERHINITGKKMKLKRAKLEQNEPALVMIRLDLAEHLGILTDLKF